MRSLTASQQAILAAPVKTVTWLFTVTDKHLHRYYWSTKTVPSSSVGAQWASGVQWASGNAWTDSAAGDGYEFRIINFSGITMARPRTEFGLMPPNTVSFTVVNKDSALSADDFEGGTVKIILMMGDTVASDTPMGVWKFLVERVSPSYQRLEFTCEDFFQQYLDGDYPSLQYRIAGTAVQWAADNAWAAGVQWTDGTASTGQTFGLKVHDVFPHTSGVGNLSDYVCIPLPFGTAYVPVRPAYITDGWYYVLGPTVHNGDAVTYTITKVRSPRDYSAKAEYTETFTQASKDATEGGTFRVFTAALSAAPLDGLYALGDHYYDLPTKFSRSDTASVTNPADVIRWVLLDIGVDPGDINETTFAAAEAVYDGWGLALNGAFWKLTTREKALTMLLAHCHSTLIVAEQIELHVLDATSRQTLTAADILRPRETGEGTFKHTRLERSLADSGRVYYSPTDDSQDAEVDALVPAKTTKRHIADEPLRLPFLADATIAKALARLYYQRKLLKKSEQRFTTKATAFALLPSDFLTLTGDNYGGTHALIVDSVTISKDVSLAFKCTEFSASIENYS